MNEVGSRETGDDIKRNVVLIGVALWATALVAVVLDTMLPNTIPLGLVRLPIGLAFAYLPALLWLPFRNKRHLEWTLPLVFGAVFALGYGASACVAREGTALAIKCKLSSLDLFEQSMAGVAFGLVLYLQKLRRQRLAHPSEANQANGSFESALPSEK